MSSKLPVRAPSGDWDRQGGSAYVCMHPLRPRAIPAAGPLTPKLPLFGRALNHVPHWFKLPAPDEWA
jgi:hypothetical protein